MRLFPFLLVIWISSTVSGGTSASVREPAVAGTFYPSDALKLRRAVTAYLDRAAPPLPVDTLALVVPHAGYSYSGQIAADGYRQVVGTDRDVIVLLGTNHTAAGLNGISVFGGSGYRTPLGVAAVDVSLTRALTEDSPDSTCLPSAHAREHSIEVQLPFLQVAFPGTPIVAAIIGTADSSKCDRFGRILADQLKDRSALIVASSDLSHYPSYRDACRVDRSTLSLIGQMNPGTFLSQLHQTPLAAANLSTFACGEAPILVAMVAARAMGARQGVLLGYANSGDTLEGSADRVVGYAAMAFASGGPGSDLSRRVEQGRPIVALDWDHQPALTLQEKSSLLSMARETVEQYLLSETLPLIRDLDGALCKGAGIFVTLRNRGKLRGCVGRVTPDLPLGRAAGRYAFQAAFRDRRFPPVSSNELPALEFEISVLTPPRPVQSPSEVRPGKDGVVLKKQGRTATFLPQVAIEQNWGRKKLLDQLCLKAGLPMSCWTSGAELKTFQGFSFRESDFTGGQEP